MLTESPPTLARDTMSDHAHDHDHPAHLAHHFETPEQQMESGKLGMRSEEHTSELQSLTNLVCRLLLEKKKKNNKK